MNCNRPSLAEARHRLRKIEAIGGGIDRAAEPRRCYYNLAIIARRSGLEQLWRKRPSAWRGRCTEGLCLVIGLTAPVVHCSRRVHRGSP